MVSCNRDWRFPLQVEHIARKCAGLPPSYAKIHGVLSNPVYAGAYVYGKSRQERYTR